MRFRFRLGLGPVSVSVGTGRGSRKGSAGAGDPLTAIAALAISVAALIAMLLVPPLALGCVVGLVYLVAAPMGSVNAGRAGLTILVTPFAVTYLLVWVVLCWYVIDLWPTLDGGALIGLALATIVSSAVMIGCGLFLRHISRKHGDRRFETWSLSATVTLAAPIVPWSLWVRSASDDSSGNWIYTLVAVAYVAGFFVPLVALRRVTSSDNSEVTGLRLARITIPGAAGSEPSLDDHHGPNSGQATLSSRQVARICGTINRRRQAFIVGVPLITLAVSGSLSLRIGL